MTSSNNTTKFSKLLLAEKLTAEAESDNSNYNKNLEKGIKLYNQLCMSFDLYPADKLQVIISYIKSIPDEGYDMLSRWRDMLPHFKGQQLQSHVELLVLITRCEDLNSHERTITAVCLYNNHLLNVCYKCFEDIACDRSILVDYRVDAARYLFGSEDDDDREIAQEALLEIIDTDLYPSEYRYNVIAGFISKTGINTKLNMTKIRISYDEQFVYGLQTNFFYNSNNGVNERILSGQHMLDMTCVDDKEKEDICKILLDIADNTDHTENTRADAADVVMRLGKGEDKKKARQIIADLGYNTVNKNKGFGSIIDKAYTIYNDSQNVHGFTEQINRFIEKIINETNIKVRNFHEVHQEVAELITKNKDGKDRFKAFKALNRISIDTAKFTKYKISLAEIFVHVWIRIQNYKNDIKEALEKRMIEELIDMNDTCSSGHSGRFVNILSTYDDTLKISWEEQIIANMAGRMTAKIRDCPDQDLRGRLAIAQTPLAEEEDRKDYVKFIEGNLKKLKEELYKEFVIEGYTTKDIFEKAFEKGTANWL